MSPPSDIAVILHERQRFWGKDYLLEPLIREWERRGRTVHVLEGTSRFVPAGIAVLHVDLTVSPEEYLAFAARYPVAVNGGVRDISKRAFSENLWEDDPSWDGPVLVKTDRNFGGLTELGLRSRTDLRGRLARLLRRQLPLRFGGWPHPHHYPVYSSAGRVPSRVWRDPALVVEKFLPEHEDGLFCLRQWSFVGDREYYTWALATAPIVKAPHIVRRKVLTPEQVPETLRRLRERLAFDFGKFDFAIRDGKAVVYDVNRTPSFRLNPLRLDSAEIVAHLAAGIESFEARPGAAPAKLPAAAR